MCKNVQKIQINILILLPVYFLYCADFVRNLCKQMCKKKLLTNDIIENFQRRFSLPLLTYCNCTSSKTQPLLSANLPQIQTSTVGGALLPSVIAPLHLQEVKNNNSRLQNQKSILRYTQTYSIDQNGSHKLTFFQTLTTFLMPKMR